jgi:ketosteroid isomerase-like protein
MDTERIILVKLDLFIERIASKDARVVDELWGDGKFALIGSERDEICRTRAELDGKMRAIFASPATLRFAWPDRSVTVVGTVAWVLALGDLVIRDEAGETRRSYLATCIFERVGDEWRWRQFFGSEPA